MIYLSDELKERDMLEELVLGFDQPQNNWWIFITYPLDLDETELYYFRVLVYEGDDYTLPVKSARISMTEPKNILCSDDPYQYFLNEEEKKTLMDILTKTYTGLDMWDAGDYEYSKDVDSITGWDYLLYRYQEQSRFVNDRIHFVEGLLMPDYMKLK